MSTRSAFAQKSAEITAAGGANEARAFDSAVVRIADHAAQKNLLVLNAITKAFRDGECGHGFAGGARDVMALAQKNARSCDDVSRQIAAFQV